MPSRSGLFLHERIKKSPFMRTHGGQTPQHSTGNGLDVQSDGHSLTSDRGSEVSAKVQKQTYRLITRIGI